MGRNSKRDRKHEPYRALKAYQTLENLTNADIAEKLGMCERTYWEKASGFSDFTVNEGIALSGILHKTLDEIFLP